MIYAYLAITYSVLLSKGSLFAENIYRSLRLYHLTLYV